MLPKFFNCAQVLEFKYHPLGAMLRQRVIAATSYFLTLIGAFTALYAKPNYWRQPLSSKYTIG